ncbi:hypothetical protein VOLCADRAFT_102998 [Volvox carteri f. nagariensis]|uniref:IQCH-like ATP-grasp domain-containing protein n=1 Tax=Volvox carteri f. nagariensis TaxID=3068 RepID=D8TJ89_VOLCA|nr:uncharacterized protein VOLCADRAFT_102998 [Volvox carteri f. nagariensis]EFJ52332.1 hypothetical protein VOLCADRAFT_102998 [Volvox carteri f. nagariensis]|eukprot:XP_002946405.1 hypothetical protein VOLCADRAFT_102998 [Volvox carteri f. nagariensis]
MDHGHAQGGKAAIDPHDVTDVLQQALWELKRLKNQLAKPYATRSTVAANIARLEDDIRRQALAIAHATGVEASLALPAPSPPPVGLSLHPKAPAHLPPPSTIRADQFLATRSGPLLDNPITETARQYLQERFAVPYQPKQPPPPGNLAKGRTPAAAPGVILPKHIREDPHGLPPPEVTDLELDKGLLHVLNRGLLPARSDLTPALCGATGPIRTAPVPVHPYQKQFERGPVTSALEDALTVKQDFKLDLLTPVIRPQQESKQISHHTLSIASVAGGGIMAQPRPPHAPVYFPGVDSSSEPQSGSQYRQSVSGLDAQQQQQAAGTAPSRAFESLMDAFSLHEVMIRKGAVVRDTPEFESYQRTFTSVWPVVEGLLQHLAALCAQYAVPLAVVNGKSLADLAEQVGAAGYQPAMEDLLVCLTNIQEVAALLKQPGRRFLGPGGRDAAAQLIQAQYRGHLARRKDSVRGQASLKIQHAWRTSRLRKQLRERMRMARLERDMRFTELRDQLEQQWPLMQSNAHVVVHVPNLLPTPVVAPGDSAPQRRPEPHLIQAMLLREAAQLARLCDLAEPLVDLILVLPSPPDPEVMHYWNKLLEVGGVRDPASRYRIVVPENYVRLPGHMSVTAKLLSSPRALKRIAAAVHGRLAYIVPGNVHDEEVELSVHLGVPLLGPSPSVCRALSRKSAARELFKTIDANIAPGCAIRPQHASTASHQLNPQLQALTRSGRDSGDGATGDILTTPLRAGTAFAFAPDGELIMREPMSGDAVHGSAAAAAAGSGSPPPRGSSSFEHDEQRILMTLAEAMVRHPLVPKWLFKIDDEIMGMGHAFFDTASIKGCDGVLERVIGEVTGSGPRSPGDALRLELGLSGSGDGGGAATGGSVPPLTEVQRVAMFRLYELLFRQLPRRLHLTCRESYPTYRDYVTTLARRGGVLEGCPHMAVGSPCANLFIDPNGAVTVLSTHEKIFCYPYRAVGTTFPQSSVPHRALYDAALAVGRSAYTAGLLGHVMVDFVTLLEPPGGGADVPPPGSANNPGGLRLWLVDLRPGITPSLTAFQLFDFLAAGTFNPMTGAYLVELDPIEDTDQGGDEDGRGQGKNVMPPGADAMALGPAPQSLRYYFVLDQLQHPAIRSMPCSKFFYYCWQHGFHFDVDHRQGVIFNLSDRYLTSGALGCMTVGLTPASTYSVMQRVLSFISATELDAAQRSDWSLTVEATTFQDVQALVKFMAEQSASQEREARVGHGLHVPGAGLAGFGRGAA